MIYLLFKARKIETKQQKMMMKKFLFDLLVEDQLLPKVVSTIWILDHTKITPL
jgi:hypothetical protein